MDDLPAKKQAINPQESARETGQRNNQQGQEMESKAIRPEVLSRLRSSLSKLGSQAFFELINAYLGEAESRVVKMQRALAQGNMPELYLAAHTLKSSSALVGAAFLAGLCQQLEADASDSAPPNVYEMLTLIEAEYNRVKVALEAELADK